MKGNQGGPAPGAEALGQDPQQLGQVGQFPIHQQPQRLKGPHRRMLHLLAGCRPQAPIALPDRVLDDAGQLSGPLDRGDRPGLHDRPGDGRRLRFVSQGFQVFDPLHFGQGSGQLGGGSAPAAIQTHVENAVADVGKAPFGIVQLQARHAEVGHEDVDPVESLFGQDAIQPGEIGVDEAKGMAGFLQTWAGPFQVLGIEIEPEQKPLRPDAAGQFDRMAAETQGTIDGDLPRTGIQHLQDFRQEDRHMTSRRGAAPAYRTLAEGAFSAGFHGHILTPGWRAKGKGIARFAMLIAVTGATGFLGRYIVRRLAAAGHRLRCWYRPQSDLSGHGTASGSIEWLPGQLGNPAAETALLDGVDAMVHAALERPPAAGFTTSGQEDLLGFLQTNLVGSLRLFQEACRRKIGRFVFLSTCAVHEVILADRPLDEAHPLWPTSHYGAHKAALEKFVHSFGLGERWPICALRPTGIYGLAHPPRASRWFDLVGQVLRGEPIATARGGKEVHAADVAGAVELLLQAPPEAIAGQAYNCFDRYVAEQEVARLAAEITGSASTIADLNRGPKNLIDTTKIRALGMTFGGEEQLRRTVRELVEAQSRGSEPGP